MNIQIHIDVEMAKKKISLTELSKRIGISMTNLSLLKTGKVKGIRFSTLSAICQILECQPGDLLSYSFPQSTNTSEELQTFEKSTESKNKGDSNEK